MKNIIDYVKRHGLYIGLGIIALLFISPVLAEYKTIGFCILFEAVAIALSSVALYSFTQIPFTKRLIDGGDDHINPNELIGLYRVVAAVFIGVHLLVAIIVLGSYHVIV